MTNDSTKAWEREERWRVVYGDGHRGRWQTWESMLYMINCGERLWKRRVPCMDAVRVERMADLPSTTEQPGDGLIAMTRHLILA